MAHVGATVSATSLSLSKTAGSSRAGCSIFCTSCSTRRSIRSRRRSSDRDDVTAPERTRSEEEIAASQFAGDIVLDGCAEEIAQASVDQARGSVERLKSVVPDVAGRFGVDSGALANYLAFRLSWQGINWWGAAANLQRDDENRGRLRVMCSSNGFRSMYRASSIASSCDVRFSESSNGRVQETRATQDQMYSVGLRQRSALLQSDAEDGADRSRALPILRRRPRRLAPPAPARDRRRQVHVPGAQAELIRNHSSTRR